MIVDQQNVGIYIFRWQMFFNNSFYIASHGAAISFLIWTSSLFFFFRPLYLSTRFLCFDHWTFYHSLTKLAWLTCFRVSGCFLWFFWMLWMLLTVHKLCHVPHGSRILTRGTIFTERLFSVSKGWVRSWSHAFFINYDKTLTNSFRPEEVTRRKKTKTRMTIAKTIMLTMSIMYILIMLIN